MRKISLVLCVVLVVSVFATACGNGGGGGAADDRVYELNVNFTVGEASAANIVNWLDDIAEQSGGRLVFNYFYSNSLMSIPEIPRGIHAGIADISQLPLPNFPSQFPLNTRILQLPFMELGDITQATEIFTQIFYEFDAMQEELAASGIRMLTVNSFGGYQLQLSQPTDVRVPADLGGLRILTQKTEVAQLIANNRGAPIELPPPEFFSALDRGVADGFVNMFGFLTMFGLHEVINSQIVFGDHGIFTDFNMVVIRIDTFNELPEDLQQLFIDNAPTLRDAEIGHLSNMSNAARARAEENGNTIITLTPEEIEVWRQDAIAIHEDTIRELEQAGRTDAREIYNRVVEIVSQR